MLAQPQLSRVGPRVVLGASIALIVGFSALMGRVGADAQWLAALGHVIVGRHGIPVGVPFAAAPTAHWPNTLVLAELIFDGLQSAFGARGLMLAQLAAVLGALLLLARDARDGGADELGAGGGLLLAALGALTSLAIARVQLFSLLLFPALVALLRAEVRSPSRRIWLAVPLLALWSNLHGAALLGLGVVLAYLALERGRRQPALAAAVAAGCSAATCLTPALWRTPAYYIGLMTNTAAQRGQGMWAPLSLHSPLDLLLILAAVLMIARAWRARPRLWEWAVVAVLIVLTVRADRDGVWLLFFLVAPAARALAPARSLRLLLPLTVAAAALMLAVGLARGPAPSGASAPLVRDAVSLAAGSPVLADSSIDEQVALAGGRIWAGNPIDAFPRRVQAAYLNWVDGDAAGERAIVPGVRVVLVSRGSATQTLMAHTPGFVVARADTTAVLYERAGAVAR